MFLLEPDRQRTRLCLSRVCGVIVQGKQFPWTMSLFQLSRFFSSGQFGGENPLHGQFLMPGLVDIRDFDKFVAIHSGQLHLVRKHGGLKRTLFQTFWSKLCPVFLLIVSKLCPLLVIKLRNINFIKQKWAVHFAQPIDFIDGTRSRT